MEAQCPLPAGNGIHQIIRLSAQTRYIAMQLAMQQHRAQAEK